MSQYTPGPWKVEFDGPFEMSICDEKGNSIPGITIWLDDACFDKNPEIEANAQRIVQCVNAHDELLEALEDAFPILEREADDEPGKAFLKFVKATIAKARGES